MTLWRLLTWRVACEAIPVVQCHVAALDHHRRQEAVANESEADEATCNACSARSICSAAGRLPQHNQSYLVYLERLDGLQLHGDRMKTIHHGYYPVLNAGDQKQSPIITAQDIAFHLKVAFHSFSTPTAVEPLRIMRRLLCDAFGIHWCSSAFAVPVAEDV